MGSCPLATGRKIRQSLGAVAAWAAVVGLGTFGTFSDPATPFSSIEDDVPRAVTDPRH